MKIVSSFPQTLLTSLPFHSHRSLPYFSFASLLPLFPTVSPIPIASPFYFICHFPFAKSYFFPISPLARVPFPLIPMLSFPPYSLLSFLNYSLTFLSSVPRCLSLFSFITFFSFLALFSHSLPYYRSLLLPHSLFPPFSLLHEHKRNIFRWRLHAPLVFVFT